MQELFQCILIITLFKCNFEDSFFVLIRGNARVKLRTGAVEKGMCFFRFLMLSPLIQCTDIFHIQ